MRDYKRSDVFYRHTASVSAPKKIDPLPHEADTQMELFSTEQGDALRDVGIRTAAEHAATFVEQMRTEAKKISGRIGCVTSDDLRHYAHQLKIAPPHPNAWGAVFRASGWIAIGRIKSSFTSNHSREIKVWKWIPPTST